MVPPPVQAQPPPPSTHDTHAGKGKGRAADEPRGVKRSLASRKVVDDGEDAPIDDDDLTPKKKTEKAGDTPSYIAGLPSVSVEIPSPPRPSRRARLDPEAEKKPAELVAIATGKVSIIYLSHSVLFTLSHLQDMCGPCQETAKTACISQAGAQRPTTACTFCSQSKNSCKKPRPVWAQPVFDAIQERGGCTSDVPPKLVHCVLTHK